MKNELQKLRDENLLLKKELFLYENCDKPKFTPIHIDEEKG